MEKPDERKDELQRLRALVGPSEKSYEELQRDRDGAVLAARDALAEVGALRGDAIELRVQLSRARQDQEHFQVAASMKPAERVVYLARRRWATSITPRAMNLARRVKRVLR